MVVDVGTYQYNTRYTVRLCFYTFYAYVPATPCYSDVEYSSTVAALDYTTCRYK